jgi:hypothetical protein
MKNRTGLLYVAILVVVVCLIPLLHVAKRSRVQQPWSSGSLVQMSAPVS